MDNPGPKSNRRHERARELVLVNYREVDFEADMGDFADGTTASTVNISAGGMLIRATEQIAPGTHLEVRFSIKKEDPPIVVMARVVRCEIGTVDGMYFIAVEYPMLSGEDRARINAYVGVISEDRGC